MIIISSSTKKDRTEKKKKNGNKYLLRISILLFGNSGGFSSDF